MSFKGFHGLSGEFQVGLQGGFGGSLVGFMGSQMSFLGVSSGVV